MKRLLAKASLISLSLQGLGAALLFFVEVFVARRIGVYQFGIYSTVTAWIYLLSIMATMGMNQLLLRFIPEYLAKEDHASLKGIISRANLWSFVATLVILVLGIIGMYLFNVTISLFEPFLWALISLPFIVLSSLRQAVLRGIGKFTYALLPEFIIRPSLILILLAFFALIKIELGAVRVIQIVLTASIFAYFIGAFWQSKKLSVMVDGTMAIYRDREWVRVAIPLFVVVGLGLISIRIDIVMLSMLDGTRYVGIYSAASRIADVVVFSLVSANIVIIPMIARLNTSKNKSELESLVRLASKGTLLFSLPMVIFLVIFGHDILRLFGTGFASGYTVLVILILGQLASLISGPVGPLLMMTGHQDLAAKLVAISAVLNIGLNLILIPVVGMVGAAISTAVSLITLNLIMYISVRRRLNINPAVL